MGLEAYTANQAPGAATEVDLVDAADIGAGDLFANGVLYVTNRGGSDTTVDVRLVPSGDTAGNQHYILEGAPLLAGDTQIIPIKSIASGDELKVLAASANVSFTLNGFLITA